MLRAILYARNKSAFIQYDTNRKNSLTVQQKPTPRFTARIILVLEVSPTNNHAYAFIGYTGQEVTRFELPWDGPAPDAGTVRVEGPAVESDRIKYMKASRGTAPGDVTRVEAREGKLCVEIVPLTTRADFALAIGDERFARDSFTLHTRTADDKFARLEEGSVMYRLYTPNAQGPRPMILFLHGGGNGGHEGERDNNKHIVTDYGPVNFAEKYPDLYVMAPMAVEARRDMSAFRLNNRFADSDSFNVPGYGWCREYLAQVCDIIRRMAAEGKVDARRIYVTGMSMGGAGTIRAMSVGADLFAACLPVCPTMTPETFTILSTLRSPVWVATAYIDHTLYRHKYIVDAVMHMRDMGNDNAHLTLFSPEDLEKYDIAITPELPYPRLFGENHASWVPAYNNEYGIMSWLLNQFRAD